MDHQPCHSAVRKVVSRRQHTGIGWISVDDSARCVYTGTGTGGEVIAIRRTLQLKYVIRVSRSVIRADCSGNKIRRLELPVPVPIDFSNDFLNTYRYSHVTYLCVFHGTGPVPAERNDFFRPLGGSLRCAPFTR